MKLEIELRDKQMKRVLDWGFEHRVMLRGEHLERMCAAYLLATDIDPRDVVLVEEQYDLMTTWRFAHKDEVEQLITGERMEEDEA